MPVNFHDIAIAISGPRRTGRTRAIIKTSPENAVILAATQRHGQTIQEMAHEISRNDLRTMPISQNLRGLKGPFVLDHFATETLLHRAGEEVERLKAELKQKEAQLSDFQKGIPIETAKTDGTVYNYYVTSEEKYEEVDRWEHVSWDERYGWHYWDYYCDRAETVKPKIVHPLPIAVKEDT